MTPALRLLRRYLILALMAALAVNAWPSFDPAEFEDAGSRPWQQSEQQSGNTSAILEAETGAAEDAAAQRTAIALAAIDTGAFLSPTAGHVSVASLVTIPHSPISLPDKTGPPSA